jgi:hypothetical protein
VLNGNVSGAEYPLQSGNIAEDEDDDEGEEDGGEEVEVLGGFVESGWVLEYAEMTGSGCH